MRKPVNRDDNGRFLTTEQMVRRYNMNKNKIIELGRESGAMIKYGRLSRFDVEKMDDYLIREYAEV